MSEEIAKGGGNELSTDLSTITAEINAYQRVAGEAIFEIGRRLKHVKEEKIAERHGGWTEWLRAIEMSTSQADRFMKIHSELGDGKFPTSGSIALGKFYEIATLPPEQREVEHEVGGQTKKPSDMTVRELRDLKRQLKAEQTERERLERENEELSNKEPEVRTEYKTEYIEVKDELAEQRAKESEARLREYEERFGDIRNYDEHVTATHRQDMIVAVMSFSRGIREFAKRYSYMTEYEAVIANLDETSRRQFNEAVKALKSLGDSFNIVGQGGAIIDAEYSEI